MLRFIHFMAASMILWGVGSYAEVVAHNLEPDYQYNKANAFELLNDAHHRRFEETTESITENPKECLGVFRCTAYCPCSVCSEGYGRHTATGKTATAGRTIAVDPSVIPYGTAVEINGHTYIAEDCGGDIKDNRIDIFFDTHSETLDWGVRSCNVYK